MCVCVCVFLPNRDNVLFNNFVDLFLLLDFLSLLGFYIYIIYIYIVYNGQRKIQQKLLKNLVC